MDAESLIQNANGQVEGYGITVLDTVKHAVKAIMHSLGKDDRLALVRFLQINLTPSLDWF